RCSELLTCDSAPSAVCDIEMPSLALRIATFMPRVCAFMRSAMARPAASSLAEFTRMPDDSRCMEVASEPCDALRLRCAFSEAMLVLIVNGMWILQDSGTTGESAGTQFDAWLSGWPFEPRTLQARYLVTPTRLL